MPIGHLALDKRPDEFEYLGLPRQGPIYIAGLYISWPLQKYGIGKAAMTMAVDLAKTRPLNATMLVLDTVREDQQMSKEFIERVYLGRGKPAPRVRMYYPSMEQAKYKTGHFSDANFLGVRSQLRHGTKGWAGFLFISTRPAIDGPIQARETK